MTTKDRIKNWLKRVSQPDGLMEREDIVFLMVQARHLIENHPDISKYKAIEFYSDWIVHTQLDRPSEIRLSVFRDITKSLSTHWTQSSGEVPLEVSRAIGLSNLRAELVALFEENQLPVEIFTIYDNWVNVVSFLTYFLANKPLNFPDEKKIQHKGFKETIKDILNMEKPANFWIKNLSIVGDKEVFVCFEIGGDKNTTKFLMPLLIEKD